MYATFRSVARSLSALLLLSLSVLLSAEQAHAQGCVAIRHMSACGSGGDLSQALMPGSWLAGMNYRYFRSFRHFRGDVEEPDRVTENTEVINYSHSLDINLNYGITSRLYAVASIPLVYNLRSSLYEHGRTERHETGSAGLGDMRLGAGYWLLDPAGLPEGNVAVGLGLKIPTGNAGATDEFYNVGPGGTTEVRPVDQSIQPGDGGWGFTLDFQGNYRVSNHLGLYAGGFYLFNPRDTNETRTYRETLSAVLGNEAYMSVPDQYSVRAGGTYGIGTTGLTASLGGRFEGVPVEDLIGGSEGFRRPGKVLSVEPGLLYSHDRLSAQLYVPVALYRNRPQSVTDRQTEIATGEPRNGDAAFADYLINVGVSWKFGE